MIVAGPLLYNGATETGPRSRSDVWPPRYTPMIEESNSPQQDDQFKEFLGVLRRRKGLLFGGIALCIALGVVLIAVSAPSYQVTTRVLLNNYAGPNFRPSNNPVDQVSVLGKAPEIGAQIGQLQSPAIVGQALQDANVNLAASEELSKQVVVVEQEGTTPVLSIQVNLPDADSASRLAQAIPAAYNTYVQTQNDTLTTNSIDSLKTKLDASRKDLNATQNKYEAFLAEQGTTVAAGNAEGAERTQRLNTFEQQLEGAKVSELAAESALQSALTAQSRIPKEIQDINVRPSVERIANQEAIVADLEGQYNSLRATLQDKHPDVLALKARLDRARQYLNSPARHGEHDRHRPQHPSARPTTSACPSPAKRSPRRAPRSPSSPRSSPRKGPRSTPTRPASRSNGSLRTPSPRSRRKRRRSPAASRTSRSSQTRPSPALQVLQTGAAVKTAPVIGRTLIASTLSESSSESSPPCSATGRQSRPHP